MAEILDLQGKQFSKEGVKVTVPFLVVMEIRTVMEGANEDMIRAAMLRGVSISAALSSGPLEISTGVKAAPKELLDQMAVVQQGAKK